jgi:hypothetical protein
LCGKLGNKIESGFNDLLLFADGCVFPRTFNSYLPFDQITQPPISLLYVNHKTACFGVDVE